MITGRCYKCGALELDGKWERDCVRYAPGGSKIEQVHLWEAPLDQQAVNYDGGYVRISVMQLIQIAQGSIRDAAKAFDLKETFPLPSAGEVAFVKPSPDPALVAFFEGVDTLLDGAIEPGEKLSKIAQLVETTRVELDG